MLGNYNNNNNKLHAFFDGLKFVRSFILNAESEKRVYLCASARSRYTYYSQLAFQQCSYSETAHERRCKCMQTIKRKMPNWSNSSFEQRALNRENKTIINCCGVYIYRTRRTTFTNCHEYDRNERKGGGREWDTGRERDKLIRSNVEYTHSILSVAMILTIFPLHSQ